MNEISNVNGFGGPNLIPLHCAFRRTKFDDLPIFCAWRSLR